MKIKTQMVIMSHLSDIQHDPLNEHNNLKINFIKYLVLSYPNVLDEINPDEVYEHFCKKYRI